jgi:hypothetical protein
VAKRFSEKREVRTFWIAACLASFTGGVIFGLNRPDAALLPTSVSFRAFRSQSAEPRRAKSDLSVWADDDARIGRVFSALQEPVFVRKRFELFEAMRGLTASDLPALVKRLESLPYNIRTELQPALLERWFELDFDAAQDWSRAHPREFSVAKHWAQTNPDAAIQEALAKPDDHRPSSLFAHALERLAGGDHRAKVGKLRALPKGKLRDSVLQGVLADWATTDPAGAFAALAEISPGPAHDAARRAVMTEWASHDPAAALAQLDALLPTLQAGVLGNELVTEIAARVGDKDPRLVLDWLSQIPVEFRMAPAIATARVWAAKEPALALEWCLENGVDVVRGKRMGLNMWQAGVLGEAMTAQPAATIAWLEARPAGPDRDRLLERALADSLWQVPKEQLFGEGSAFALRLFNQLAEESQVRVATALGETRARQGDLTDLNVWAQHFAPGPARANAVAGAISAAYERDATCVEALLANVTAPADRDAALRGLAGMMSDLAPADAAARALAINDPALRRETLGTIITAWRKRDPGLASNWLRDNPAIPDAWKQAW